MAVAAVVQEAHRPLLSLPRAFHPPLCLPYPPLSGGGGSSSPSALFPSPSLDPVRVAAVEKADVGEVVAWWWVYCLFFLLFY